MTVDQQISRIRRLARTQSSSATDDDVINAINEGQTQFAKDVHGLVKEDYLTLVPKFDTRTNFSFKITTDAASATVSFATEQTDATGTTIATNMETAIQVSFGAATVTWSATEWIFAVTIPTATSITIGEPSGITQVDAVAMLFGGGSTQATATWVGEIPEDCTLETDLPTDFLKIYYVEWDNSRLTQAPIPLFMSPGYTGTPIYYAIKNKTIRLHPTPTSQKLFHILYKYLPADYGSSSGGATCVLDSEYHMAPVYYAASVLANENFEYSVSDRMFGMYRKYVSDYIIQYNNQNPAMFPKRSWINPPKVNMNETT